MGVGTTLPARAAAAGQSRPSVRAGPDASPIRRRRTDRGRRRRAARGREPRSPALLFRARSPAPLLGSPPVVLLHALAALRPAVRPRREPARGPAGGGGCVRPGAGRTDHVRAVRPATPAAGPRVVPPLCGLPRAAAVARVDDVLRGDATAGGGAADGGGVRAARGNGRGAAAGRSPR